jgi:hypothetical protein
MITFLLCYLCYAILLMAYSLLSCLHSKLNKDPASILIGGNMDFGANKYYEGRSGIFKIGFGFGWYNLWQFYIHVAKNSTPEIGREYKADGKADEYSMKEFFIGLMFMISFLAITIFVKFPMSTYLSYLSSFISYTFFIEDATVLPALDLPETIWFFLSYMCIYSIINMCSQHFLSKTKNAINLTIMFAFFYLWISTVIRLFLIYHSYWEILLLLLFIILINVTLAAISFGIFKLFFNIKKRSEEDIKKENALSKVKEYILLAYKHKILNEKTDARLLLSRGKILDLMDAKLPQKLDGVLPETRPITTYEMEALSFNGRKDKIENIFLKEAIVKNLNIESYLFESFHNSQLTVLVKQDCTSSTWNKRLTFLIEFGKEHWATIVPGDYENGFIYPWIKQVEDLG